MAMDFCDEFGLFVIDTILSRLFPSVLFIGKTIPISGAVDEVVSNPIVVNHGASASGELVWFMCDSARNIFVRSVKTLDSA